MVFFCYKLCFDKLKKLCILKMEKKAKHMYNFIVNPVSGNKKAIKNMKIISQYLTERNIAFCVYPTDKKKTAIKIASELEKCGADNIIAVGGDGTINDIINGLENPREMRIGIIPSGTGNDFAHSLKISNNPKKAMRTILKNKLRQVDYLQGNGFRAVNVVGSGLDVEVLHARNKNKIKGKFGYFISLLKVLFCFDFYRFRIFVDGQILANSEFMLVAGCNGSRFGGGMKVSPYSQVRDGRINLVLIKRIKRRKIPFILFKFLNGKHLNSNYAVEVMCESLRIEGAKEMNVDGDIVSEKPFELSIVKGGMNIYLD